MKASCVTPARKLSSRPRGSLRPMSCLPLCRESSLLSRHNGKHVGEPFIGTSGRARVLGFRSWPCSSAGRSPLLFSGSLLWRGHMEPAVQGHCRPRRKAFGEAGDTPTRSALRAGDAGRLRPHVLGGVPLRRPARRRPASRTARRLPCGPPPLPRGVRWNRPDAPHPPPWPEQPAPPATRAQGVARGAGYSRPGAPRLEGLSPGGAGSGARRWGCGAWGRCTVHPPQPPTTDSDEIDTAERVMEGRTR